MKTWNWLQAPEAIPAESILSEERADILVLGGGHAGTAAALAAAEAGASVIVLEQQGEKNFQVFGAQMGVLNSRFLQARGLPEYDPVEFMEEYQHRSLNRANPFLIRQYAYHSGETLDWLTDRLTTEARDNIKIFMQRKPSHYSGISNGFRTYQGTAMFVNTNFSIGPGGRPNGAPLSMTPATREMHARITALGGRIFYGITLHDLVQENGRITGAIGRDRQKQYIKFCGEKGVILATGDFSANRDMVMDLLPEYAELIEYGEKYPWLPAGRRGTGIRLGLLAGGHMEPGPRGGMWACVRGNGGPLDGTACLRLNSRGKRYTNEGILGYWGAGLQGARQPAGPIVTLWDANWREELECQQMGHNNVDVGDDFTMQDKARIMERAREAGVMEIPGAPGAKAAPNRLYCAETLEELAEKLGYTDERKAVFLASVDRYNELCAAGRDEDFAKDPNLLHPLATAPFYGYQENDPRVGFLMVTVCGLVVDENQQVVDSSGDPIPGLFATGNCSGERFPIMYTTPISGISIGMAWTLGKAVGEYLAGL